MIKTRYIRRHYIEQAVAEFRPTGRILEVGSGKRWKYYPNSRTLNRDASAEPDIVGDAEAMQVGDGSIDCLVCLEVLEHTPSPDTLLAEAHRVLKPGGRLLLTIPFVFEIHDCQDYQRFTRQGLEQKFSGWRNVRISPNGGRFCAIFHFFRLGISGRVLWPVYNNLGYVFDKLNPLEDYRVTLGYTVFAQK